MTSTPFGSTSVSDLTGKTFLLIDDEEPTRDVLADILDSMGAKVLAAEDGPQGIELFKKNAESVSMVIVDLSMPNMNGAEVATRLKQMSSAARIVLSSGYAEDDIKRRFDCSGCDGFIQKPFRPNAFLDLIGRVLSK